MTVTLFMGLLAVSASQASGPNPVPPMTSTASAAQAATPPRAGPAQDAVSVPAQALVRLPGLFSTDDYPAEALRNEETGTVAFAVAVGRDGRVTGCTVTTSSGSASLDQTTCRIVQSRARFSPARDARNRTVEDRTTGRVHWQLPLHEVKDEFHRAVAALDRGAVTACRLETSRKGPGDCRAALDVIKSLIAKSDLPPAREAVIESGVRIGARPGLDKLGTGPGLHRNDIAAWTMTIAADGKVSDCRPAAKIDDNVADESACATMKRRKYELQPAGTTAPRVITYYELLYLRGATARPRLTNLPGLFGPDDYPTDALAQSREGRVGAEVTVEADGRASGCVIKASSGTPSLDAVTCAKLLRMGKYEAARDPEQRPVRGTLTTRVGWTLPRAPLEDRLTRMVIPLPAGIACAIEGSPNGEVGCDDARAVGSLALASPDAKGKRAMVVEYGQVIGAGESIERINEGRGRTPWSMSAVTLMVDAAGKLAECKPSFAWVEADDAKAQCDVAREETFEPLEAGAANRQPRALTRYEAIYFRD